MTLLETLKAYLNPKTLLARAIDSLDLLAPLLAAEIERTKAKFNKLESEEKAQWLIDKVQAFLREKFNLPTE